jgi:hypothetical protein
VTGTHGTAAHRRWAVAGGVALVAAYAALASATHPFTDGADIVTAVPLAAVVVATGVRMRAGPRAHPEVRPDGPGATPNRLGLVWVAAAAVIAGWELACYVATPRSAHPTLSSLLDALDAGHGGKTVAFALWLGLGCALVLA